MESVFDVRLCSSETVHLFVLLFPHPESGTITVPTSSGVCGQCESVRLTRGLIGTSGDNDSGNDSAGKGFPHAFLSASPLPPPVSPPSSSSVCPQSPRNLVTICLEPLSSVFGLKPLQTELKPFCQKKKSKESS